MGMAATTTVRVHLATRDALARLSEKRGLNTADLLADLVERREQDEMLEQMNASYSRQQEDPSASEAEGIERNLWDATLTDGLEEL